MKKLVSLLCTFILLLGVMVIPANAAAITVSLPKVEAAPGAQVKIPVTISNNPGVAAFLLEFSYSSDLKLTAATRNTRNDIGLALTLGGFAANPHPVKYRMLMAEDVSKAYSVKAFAWNSSEDMKPICAAYKEQLVEVPVDEPVEDESTQNTEQTEENGQNKEETQG